MISFRSHVVSLLAVFLALAVGVVLGGGPLSELGRGATADGGTASSSAAGKDLKQATAYADTFALSTAGRALNHGLAGHTVVLMALPGAPDGQLNALAGLVGTAGGTVVARYQLQSSLFDGNQGSLVDTLGSQLATMVGDKAVLTAYPRIGRLLGLATTTTTSAGAVFDTNAVSIREGLTGADLIKPVGTPVRKGDLVIVLLGDEPPSGTGADTLLAGLTAGLRGTASGVVVAGTAASGSSGLLADLRGNQALAKGVSTVDSVDTGAGQVTAVLALISALGGTAGSYGASGSDGAVALR